MSKNTEPNVDVGIDAFNPANFRYPEAAEKAHGVYVREVERTKGVGEGMGNDFYIGRPLGNKGDVSPSREARSYHEAIPTLKGLTFEDILEQKLSTQDEVVFCDLGFGAGLADTQLIEKEPFATAMENGKLKVLAVGNPNYCQYPFRNQKTKAKMEPTADVLKKAGVKIDGRDILDVLRTLPTESIDELVSVCGISWVEYPRWDLIKEINRVLKKEGIAYLDNFSVTMSKTGKNIGIEDHQVDTGELLRERGIGIYQDSQAMVIFKSETGNLDTVDSMGETYRDNLIKIVD